LHMLELPLQAMPDIYFLPTKQHPFPFLCIVQSSCCLLKSAHLFFYFFHCSCGKCKVPHFSFWFRLSFSVKVNKTAVHVWHRLKNLFHIFSKNINHDCWLVFGNFH